MQSPYVKQFLVAAVLAGSAIGASQAFAGSAQLVNKNGDTMQFEYQGDKLRINPGTKETYMVLRDTNLYAVQDVGGKMMVIDAGKMMQMFGSMATSATPSVTSSKVVSLKPTGRKEAYAGIKGEVYSLEYMEEGKGSQQMDLVLSSDPRAVELRDAFNNMARSLAKSVGTSAENADDLQRRLQSMKMGVIRYGDEMKLSAIDGAAVDGARFELPAAPTDLSGMAGIADYVKGAGQAGQGDGAQPAGEGGGLVSGFLSKFGSKADRQQERVENKTDEKVDSATDKAVDKTVDKVLGKIFGN